MIRSDAQVPDRALGEAPRWSEGTFYRIGVAAWVVASFIATAPLEAAAPRVLEAKARNEAVSRIPFDKLKEEVRTRIRTVVSRPSIYRRLPVSVIQSDPEMYLFLVRHPEVVVNIWKIMGITKVKMQRTDDYRFTAADGAGTTTDIELVYGDSNVHVMYAEGNYEGPLFRNLIRGRCVLVLRSDYEQTRDRDVYITNQLDMFVQFDNVGAELLGRTLHPLVGKSADHNFVESTRFLGQVSRAAEAKAIGMQELAGRLTGIDADVRRQFAALAAAVNHRAAVRAAHTPVAVPSRQSATLRRAPKAMALRR